MCKVPCIFKGARNGIFHMKTCNIIIIILNIDFECSIEPPHRNEPNEYSQSMFWAKTCLGKGQLVTLSEYCWIVIWPVPEDKLTCVNKHVTVRVITFNVTLFFHFTFCWKSEECHMLWQLIELIQTPGSYRKNKDFYRYRFRRENFMVWTCFTVIQAIHAVQSIPSLYDIINWNSSSCYKLSIKYTFL